MSPADGGVVRLDTRTGAMSICSRKDDQWACVPMPDSQDVLRRDIERLEGENKELRDTVKRLEEIAGLGDDKSARAAPSTGAAPGGSSFGLPSQKDVDMAFDYVEGLVKRLWERLRKLDGDEKSKGQPL